MTPVERVLAKLPDARRCGNGWEAKCPGHDDQRASLTIATGEEERVLLKCHAGCTLDAILAGLGMPRSALRAMANGTPKASGRKVVATYDYRDEAHQLLFQVVRYDPKGFTQRRPDGADFVYNLGGVRRVVYRLDEVLAASPDVPVFITEGEKDADALVQLGLMATTNPGGAGKWRTEYNEPLRGRGVVILPDNDEAGQKHAAQVKTALDGIAASVRIVELPGLPPKGDVSDWLAAGGSGKALLTLATTLDVRTAAPPPAFNLTDLGNAERLVRDHGHDLRFCAARGWLVWDGHRWAPDATAEVMRRAKDAVRGLYAEAQVAEHAKPLAAHAMRSEARRALGDMVALAASEPGIPVRTDELDRDPWLLNVVNGTLDLRTGMLRAPARVDLLTKMAPVAFDASATCPTFLAFLKRIFDGDMELLGFVQRAVGYSLTGDVSERVLFILHGSGRNGKSTLLETLRTLLGDYALRTPTATLLAKRGDGGIPNDVARLVGARFVTASEADEGKRLAEATVKDLTGGDTISARFLNREWFDFRPTCKLWLGTNHRPVITGTDQAIWDRIRLVPFTVRIPDAEQDPHLREKLAAELPGILAWAVEGCRAWQGDGLGLPVAVRTATQGYREDMDNVGAFIADRCVEERTARSEMAALFAAYLKWCEQEGERPLSRRAFGGRLSERGFERGRGTGGARMRVGLRLLAVTEVTHGDVETRVPSHAGAVEKNPDSSVTNGHFRHSGAEQASSFRDEPVEGTCSACGEPGQLASDGRCPPGRGCGTDEDDEVTL